MLTFAIFSSIFIFNASVHTFIIYERENLITGGRIVYKDNMLKKIVSAPYYLWAAIFVVVPLAVVIYYAFTNSSGDFTLDYIKTLGNYRYFPAIYLVRLPCHRHFARYRLSAGIHNGEQLSERSAYNHDARHAPDVDELSYQNIFVDDNS